MEPEIIRVTADITELEKKLDQVDAKFAKTEKAAEGVGVKTKQSSQEATKAIDSTGKSVDSLGKAFTSIASKVAIAFAIQKISAFAKEAINVADRARGITEAFDDLNNISLADLRKSTRGLVNDLDLMTASVKAEQFGIPLERLGELLQFAQIRATQTGQSVAFLTESIVNGLGRKSTLILDNLGITSVQLQDALGGVGLAAASTAQLTNALADSIQGELQTAMNQSVSSTEKLAVIQDNLTLRIGNALLPAFDSTVDILEIIAKKFGLVETAQQSAFNSEEIQKMNAELEKALGLSLDFQVQQLRNQGVSEQQIENIVGGYRRQQEAAFLSTASAEELRAKVDELTAEFRIAGNESADFVDRIRAKLVELERVDAGKGIVESLKEQIKLINDQIETTPDQEELNRLLREKVTLEDRLATALGKSTEAYKLKNEVAKDALMSDRSILREELDAFDAREESVDDFYEKQLDALVESNEQKRQVDRDYADYQEGLAQEQSLALIEAAGNTFAAISTLAGENAEAQKALAIFQAIINAYLSITNVLKTVPPPAGPILATSIGALAFAQVAKIQAEPVPKFYTGTDYVALNGNKSGKDTIPAMLHEGEGVVTSQANAKWRGVVKSLNAGKFDQYMTAKHVEPALKALRKEKDMEKAALLKAAISGSVNAKLDDAKILQVLRRQTRLTEQLIIQGMAKKRNPYRA